MLNQVNDAGDVYPFHPKLLRDISDAVSTFAETANLSKNVPV